MSLDESILGFSNRWYYSAMEFSSTEMLTKELTIRVITAPYFVAMKLEAFKGRGKRDFVGSHDLEDFVAVVDGRESLASEIKSAQMDVRSYIQNEVRRLLANGSFIDALPGHVVSSWLGR